MRNLFALDLSVLILSNHLSLKKISRNSSGENLCYSILIHLFIEILHLLSSVHSEKYFLTGLQHYRGVVSSLQKYLTYWIYWDSFGKNYLKFNEVVFHLIIILHSWIILLLRCTIGVIRSQTAYFQVSAGTSIGFVSLLFVGVFLSFSLLGQTILVQLTDSVSFSIL